jgi:hypothetical protein
MKDDASANIITPEDIFNCFLVFFVELKAQATRSSECAADLWLLPMTLKKRQENPTWLGLFHKVVEEMVFKTLLICGVVYAHTDACDHQCGVPALVEGCC